MPGITPSRYVRGISNPHSAYASAEIPENVTIFKNLSRWRTTTSTTISGFVTVTFFVLMTLDTIRAYRHSTMRLLRFTHNRSHVTLAQFLLAQIHADPYTRECCECAVLIYYSSRLSLLSGAEIRLSSSTSLSLSSWNLTSLSGL